MRAAPLYIALPQPPLPLPSHAVSYSVESIRYALLAGGANVGRAAVVCTFVDDAAQPVGGASALARLVADPWPWRATRGARPFVWCAGAAAARQVDEDLVEALKDTGFEIALETDGTRRPPGGIDWITVTPRTGGKLVVLAGNELRLEFPQRGMKPEQLEALEFRHFFLQPGEGPNEAENTRLAAEYCLAHPRWRLTPRTRIVDIR